MRLPTPATIIIMTTLNWSTSSDRPKWYCPAERDDQPEADHDFGRSDGHHRDREDLPVLAPVQPRERDQQQVRGVEHDLDREQDDQRRAAEHDAERAGREEQSAEHDVPLDV